MSCLFVQAIAAGTMGGGREQNRAGQHQRLLL